MRILKGAEIPLTICVSYTILSVTNAVLNLVRGQEYGSHINSVMMLLWTSIAVLVLSIHHLFDEWSPVAMILMQYLIAMGLVLLTVFAGSFFMEMHEDGYRDIFISFTVPYVIGGLLYYISLFASVKKENRLLTEIQGAAEKLQG